MLPKDLRIRRRPKGVNVVQHQMLQGRTFGQQTSQGPIAQKIRNLKEVSHGMQALERHIVRIVPGLTRAPGPSDQGGAKAVPDLLLLDVEQLLGHFSH